MRRLLFLTTILTSIFLLNNCNNTKHLTSQTQNIFRGKWQLMEIQGQEVPDSLRYSFDFTPGNIAGRTYCNLLSARFIAGKNQTVTFVTDTTNKQPCGNEHVAKLETNFLDALSKSTK